MVVPRTSSTPVGKTFPPSLCRDSHVLQYVLSHNEDRICNGISQNPGGAVWHFNIEYIMKKEEEDLKLNSPPKYTMTSAAAASRSEGNPLHDHDCIHTSGAASNFQGAKNDLHAPVGHPTMPPYNSNAGPNHYYQPQPDGYSTAQYQYMPEHGYATQPPSLHPHPPLYHHPTLPTPQQMYHDQQISQQLQYGSYPTILPPEAQNPPHRFSARCKPDQYGALQLNVFDWEDENFASALNFVKRNPKATLFDVDGIIPDIARADEGSSRFIQKRLKLGSDEERSLGLASALSSLEELWSDQYGNFMLQGIFEFGTDDMKKELMDALYGQDVVALCLHMHGCRVIQKAIRSLQQEDVCKLIMEFHDKVLTFIHDPHGNHVIQRCIQVMSSFSKFALNNDNADMASSLSDQVQFIIDDIVASIQTLSTHRYGCRVVQRAIEHCVERQKTSVLAKIVSCHEKLMMDQYGNYVVQAVVKQVLTDGSEAHQTAIIGTLTKTGSLLTLSRHKYASNVVEAVLVHGKPQHREQVLNEMLMDTREMAGGYCCVVEMVKDAIANYVVNKAIEVSEATQKEKLFEVISKSRPELSRSPYAKYVLQKIERRDK